jgi:hypothetical protein
VYLLGAANVGKSALVRSLLWLLAEEGQLHQLHQPPAGARLGGRSQPQLLPTESAMPGTTLDVMPVGALSGGGLIFGGQPGGARSSRGLLCQARTHAGAGCGAPSPSPWACVAAAGERRQPPLPPLPPLLQTRPGCTSHTGPPTC